MSNISGLIREEGKTINTAPIFGLKSLTLRQVFDDLSTICEPVLGSYPDIQEHIVEYSGVPAQDRFHCT